MEINRTLDKIHETAVAHGWKRTQNLGYFVAYERGDGEVRERVVLHFSDNYNRPRRLIRVYNCYPTGDVTALNHRPVMVTRERASQSRNKVETAQAWLREQHYARPETNALLKKLGIEPILPARSYYDEIKATAEAIARRASAIAEGRLNGPMYAACKELTANIETLTSLERATRV